MTMRVAWSLLSCLLIGCGGDDVPRTGDAGMDRADAGPGDAGGRDAPRSGVDAGDLDAGADGEDAGPLPCIIDGDGDGHVATACESGDDCDDDDADRHPGNPEDCDDHDEDCDDSTLGTSDADSDGYLSALCCNEGSCGTDCDDEASTVHPTATEDCNGVDDDCDGAVDDGATVLLYRDLDMDLHGDPSVAEMRCPDTAGFVPNASDCDDSDAARYPSAIEICNGLDDDCDSTLDDGADGTCTFPSAYGTCSSGRCVIASCDSGSGDCDGLAANGCERSVHTLTDCRGCGLACDLANATESCGSGECRVTGCATGWGNCDSDDGDGCETRLNTTTNCNACGTPCERYQASATCGTGACAIASCNRGYCNPPGSGDADGCERLLDSNPACDESPAPRIEIDADGDSGGGVDLVHSGSGEQWFRAVIRETNHAPDACENLGARFDIESTPGGDAAYTMNIRCANCRGALTYVSDLSGPQVIGRRELCGPGFDPPEVIELYVQVQWASNIRTGCGGWTVTAESDLPGGFTGPYVCD